MLWLKKRFALSDRGTIDLALAIIASTLQNLALMLPTGLIYSFVMLLTALNITGLNMNDSQVRFYIGAVFICMLLIFASSWFQYNTTFIAAHRESSARRLALVESKTNDLAALIVKNCTAFEFAQFAGAVIFVIFMALPMIYTNWKMALAALWVVPIALYLARLSSFAPLVLKLGIASTVLTGAILYTHDSLKTSEFILFILTVLKLYDPLEIALQKLPRIMQS